MPHGTSHIKDLNPDTRAELAMPHGTSHIKDLNPDTRAELAMPHGASLTAAEIASQPACWEQAARLARAVPATVDDERERGTEPLPRPGERVAVVGCGTSWFIAQSYAALRERGGHGETDAFAASEFPAGRRYDRVLAITRSGTTTEVRELLGRLGGTVPTAAITAVPDTPVGKAADRVTVLGFADERSVVQTRFATSALALLRAHLGGSLTAACADAARALAEEPDPAVLGAEQFTFLGTGWTCGLALEAALKMREAAGAWTEAYPAMEYRHGPVSITGPGRVVWVLGELPAGLTEDIARTGGTLVAGSTGPAGGDAAADAAPVAGRAAPLDPMADLVRVQRLAVALAETKGYDPDRPRHLSRSVVLPAP